MARARYYNQYAPWPRVRIEWEGGYAEVSYDFILNGPRRPVNKIMALAKKNHGWRMVYGPEDDKK